MATARVLGGNSFEKGYRIPRLAVFPIDLIKDCNMKLIAALIAGLFATAAFAADAPAADKPAAEKKVEKKAEKKAAEEKK
ncbi:MAG: hypothetical protein MO853_05840 [Candidatus Protistobacter heckmanni]|nr:hypothetical protein [Candidatus Protistobacter heckmanni]